MLQGGQSFINRAPGDRGERADEAMGIEPGGEDMEVIHVAEQIRECRDALVLRDAEVMQCSEPGLDCFPEVVEFVFTVMGDD